MEYKKYGNTVIVRIDVGDEIMSSLKKIAIDENIKLAQINGLGAASKFTIAIRNPKTKQYEETTYEGRYEISNIHGNITTLNNENYLHVHITCGNDKGETHCGHLINCIIGGTAEIFITVYDGIVDRKIDEITGLNVFKFD